MPDARLARARLTLPEGYRFGDGRAPVQPHEACRHERLNYDPSMSAYVCRCGYFVPSQDVAERWRGLIRSYRIQ